VVSLRISQALIVPTTQKDANASRRTRDRWIATGLHRLIHVKHSARDDLGLIGQAVISSPANKRDSGAIVAQQLADWVYRKSAD
jgi:hypothetical protein